MKSRGVVTGSDVLVVPDDQVDALAAVVASLITRTADGHDDGITEWSMALVREPQRTRLAVGLWGGSRQRGGAPSPGGDRAASRQRPGSTPPPGSERSDLGECPVPTSGVRRDRRRPRPVPLDGSPRLARERSTPRCSRYPCTEQVDPTREWSDEHPDHHHRPDGLPTRTRPDRAPSSRIAEVVCGYLAGYCVVVTVVVGRTAAADARSWSPRRVDTGSTS